MTETLTIRLSASKRKALRARAAATGQTESELVRELIDRQLLGRGTVSDRAGRHLGALDFEPASVEGDAWSSYIRQANVRR